MGCNQFDDYLNGYVNRNDFRAHMQNCELCSRAEANDNRIMNEAKRLNNYLSIPDLWPAIEDKIRMNEKNPRLFKFRKNHYLYLTAAATVLIISVLWILHLSNNDPVSDRILSQSALEKVKKAENDYLKAIGELEKLAYQRLDEHTNLSNQLFRNKLALIDQQIKNCQEALMNNPANSHIRRYLLSALQDKRNTLEDILMPDRKSSIKGEKS